MTISLPSPSHGVQTPAFLAAVEEALGEMTAEIKLWQEKGVIERSTF